MMKRRWLRPGLWCLVLVGVATVLPACLREAPSQVQVRAAAWRVPAGFKAQAETQAEAYTKTGWAQEIVHEGTGIALVFVPAGEFDMGSPAGERERGENEGPVHRVKITKPFYMGRYEVTQGQWQKVMDQNPSGMKGSDRLPVEGIVGREPGVPA